ncbi:HRSL1 enzyme, partial [Picathartes gymnocephalus]|nr:HRSL1 enzyme [Picathartes gymnocephalus]
LIEIDLPLHQHWALYMGDGYVINLTPAGKQTLNLGVHKVPVFTRRVEKQFLKKVVRSYKWRVNNKSDQYHTPLPVQEINQRAEGYIGKEVTYRVFGSNCEHFVKQLRYGDEVSD